MNRTKKVILLSTAALLAFSTMSMKMLLEKKVYYVAYNKISECSYWTIFFGNHKVTVNKTFPGEEPMTLEVDMNFSLLSSGYMEGWGQTERGRIEVDPSLMVVTPEGEKKIEMKDIAYVYDSGAKVKTVDGTVGELVIDADGNKIKPWKTVIRYYSHFDDQGETVLSHEGDYEIVSFGFSKNDIKEAFRQRGSSSGE